MTLVLVAQVTFAVDLKTCMVAHQQSTKIEFYSTILRSKSILTLDDEPEIISFLDRGLSKNISVIETAGDIAMATELLDRCQRRVSMLSSQTGVDGF